MGFIANMGKFLSGIVRRNVFFSISRGEFLNSGSLRDNEIVGAVANLIATNVAKLSPQVVRESANGLEVKNDNLAKLIALRPNAENSTFDFLYRMGSELVFSGNSFSIIFYNDDFTAVTAIQPVTVSSHRIFEHNGIIFFEFVWSYDGKKYIVPYNSVIHLKARYNKKRFLGTPPDEELKNSTEMLNTTYGGIKNAVLHSAGLRGYLKFNNLADEEDIKAKVKEFQESYLSASNEGGIAGIDNSYEFNEITQKPYAIPTQSISFFRDNIYRYYCVNEKALTSTMSESEWVCFYENVIEPIAIQLSQEFTYKLFSENERNHGNKVIFTTDRLQYATLESRKNTAGEMFDRGAITINEYRKFMFLPPIDDGDIRLISLNYVKADEQSEYQLNK